MIAFKHVIFDNDEGLFADEASSSYLAIRTKIRKEVNVCGGHGQVCLQISTVYAVPQLFGSLQNLLITLTINCQQAAKMISVIALPWKCLCEATATSGEGR